MVYVVGFVIFKISELQKSVDLFFKVIRGMLQGVFEEQRKGNEHILTEKGSRKPFFKIYFLNGALLDEYELTRQR